MTVAELIELLQEQESTATVRIATQPSYPLASPLVGVVSHADAVLVGSDPGDDDTQPADFVWLASGDADSYAPEGVWTS